MSNSWGPIQGFLVGLLLIVFRKIVAVYIEKAFKKFPKYEEGTKSLHYQYVVKPIYITILGGIFILIALGGFITMFTS